jgi:hypothetical protein
MKPNAYLEAIDAKLEAHYKSDTITMEVNLSEPENYIRPNFDEYCESIYDVFADTYLEDIDAKLEANYKRETITMEANLSEPEDYVRANFVEDCVPLRDMNDVQIEKYIELSGRCTFDERDEWSMVYTGGNILRYSYCEFIQWGIEDQTVSNITIRRALFDEINFDNCVFDGVEFQNCVFKEIILNNTTFKNCTFIECDLDSSIVPDESCEVTNYHPYYDSDDNVVYRLF